MSSLCDCVTRRASPVLTQTSAASAYDSSIRGTSDFPVTPSGKSYWVDLCTLDLISIDIWVFAMSLAVCLADPSSPPLLQQSRVPARKVIALRHKAFAQSFADVFGSGFTAERWSGDPEDTT